MKRNENQPTLPLSEESSSSPLLGEQTKSLEDKGGAPTSVRVRQNGLSVDSADTRRYVVGFMFDFALERVALIRKNKPAWQAGLLNGIGGKIEPNETAQEAMRRECIEEVGMDTDWHFYCNCSGLNNDGAWFSLDCFWSQGALQTLKAQESEQIEILTLTKVIVRRSEMIGNLPWHLELARDFATGVFPPRIVKAEYGPSVVDGNEAQEGADCLDKRSAPEAAHVRQSRGASGSVGKPRPRIHNKKLLAAIHAAVIEHSGNGELADHVVEHISADSVQDGNAEPNTHVLQIALRRLFNHIENHRYQEPRHWKDHACAQCVGGETGSVFICALHFAEKVLSEHAPKSSLGSELPEADITFHETRYQRSSTSDGSGLPKAEEE